MLRRTDQWLTPSALARILSTRSSAISRAARCGNEGAREGGDGEGGPPPPPARRSLSALAGEFEKRCGVVRKADRRYSSRRQSTLPA